MEIALAKSIAGGVFYALALVFLTISILAAFYTWKTGKHSSGLPILPTFFAVAGGLFTGLWKVTVVFVLLDLGSLFFPLGNRRSQDERRSGS